MHQALGELVASRVGETEARDRVEGVALLRAASAIAAADARNALGAAEFGNGFVRFELHEEGAVEPSIEYLIAHREERLVAGGVADFGEHRERPVRAAPFRVHLLFANAFL